MAHEYLTAPMMQRMEDQHPIAVLAKMDDNGFPYVAVHVYTNPDRVLAPSFSVKAQGPKEDPTVVSAIRFSQVELNGYHADEYLAAGAIATRLSRYYTTLVEDVLRSKTIEGWVETFVEMHDAQAMTEMLLLLPSGRDEDEAQSILVKIMASGLYGDLRQTLAEAEAPTILGLARLCSNMPGFEDKLGRVEQPSDYIEAILETMRPLWNVADNLN